MHTVQRSFKRKLNAPLLRSGPSSYATQHVLTPSQDEFLLYVESAGTLLYDIKRSDSVMGMVITFSTFFRSITSASVTGSLAGLFTKLAEELSDDLPFWQSSSWIDVCDDFHKNIHRVKDCALGKKLIKVLNHVIAHTFYFKMGISVDDKIFSQLEKNYIQPTVWNVLTFADAIVGLLLFLSKAGRQAVLTGSADAFFVDSETVSNWLLKANRLRKDAEFLGNPSAIGLDTITYLTDVADAIEDGKRLCKSFWESQKILVNNVIVELEMVQKRYQSAMAAASFRFCPIGLFIWGDSGVGKSFIVKGLFYHYASVRDIKKEKAVLYSRNPDDKYYSGFKSSMLGILYDDVAKHVASKVMGIDQSLADIIGAVNNIPLITNQAEAFDKGKIPMLCEWMGITSNIAQLNVHAYYNNTYAVLRRMPYRIEPIVKEAFRKPGTTQIDSSLIPQGVLYPDCWTFKVCEVVRHDANSLHGQYADTGCEFGCYSDLLVWLTGVYKKHIDNQTRLLDTVNAVGPETLCKCNLPVSLCVCVHESQIIADVPEKCDTAAEAQLGDADKRERMMAAVEARRTIMEKYSSLHSSAAMYFNAWRTHTLEPWISEYTVSEVVEITPEEMICEIDEEMASFDRLPIREKIFAISRYAGISVDTGDDYLTFVPKIGGKRNFIRSQLKVIHDYILKYVALADWKEEQLAALEVFVYEKVPQYLALGWDDDSLLKAAFDFVDANAVRLAAGDRTARELLLADLDDEPTLRDKVCRFFGVQYFSRPWLFKTVNYIASTRVGGYVGKKCFQSTDMARAGTLVDAGGAYNKSLMGDHGMVILMIAVGSSIAIIAVVRFALRFFSKSEGQLSLDAIGKKPKQRDDEKVNVWRVEERNITALDFHPRRPNRLSQMLPGIRNNSLIADIYVPGVARATTRILVINNSTFVMNNHSCFDNFQMTIYLGKKVTEGVVAKFVVDVEPSMIRRVPERDLAIITTMAMPSLFKDISAFLPKKSFSSVGPSFYYVPQPHGESKEIPVIGVSRAHLGDFIGSRAGVDMQSLVGRPQEKTLGGDCGSPLIIQTGFGPVVAGIHCAFNEARFITHAAPIFYEDFEIVPMVQVGVVTPSGIVAQSDLSEKDKLYTDFHKEGQLMVFGALRGFRPRPKANGRHTAIAPFLLYEGPMRGLNMVDRLTNPDMGSWEPQQNILKEYLCPTHSMKESLFRICCDSFSEHLTSGFTKEDVEDVHVVPLSVAVNGFPGVPNVDAQKFTTSAGHGFPGPKKKYIQSEEEFEEWSTFREYDAEVVAEITRIYELTVQGIRTHPIFTAQLKDEMISLAKRAMKKTRGFYMCPVAFLTVMRMFTTGLTRVMVRRRDLFRHAVGLNTHSEQWDDLYKESQKIPGDNWMAGDFKGFDKILSILIQNGAKKVFLAVAKHCGFTEQELLALDTLLSDNITAVVDFFGTLIMLLGGEVSGHQITTFFNSICNILLHLYAWVVLAVEMKMDPTEAARQFWVLVFIRVLGDDIMAKVHPDAPWYNHTSVQRIFDSIGIVYTMADKLSESVPYISYEEVGFLKRRFANHELFPGMKVAPLDKESIYKMLIYTNPSKAVSEEEQLAMAICSAMSEAFFHGHEFYHQLASLIEDAPKTPELEARMEQFPAPTWNQMYERFLFASPKHRVLLVKPELQAEATPTPSSSHCHSSAPQAQTAWRMDCWGSTTMERSSEESDWTGIRLSPKKPARRRRVEKNRDVEDTHLSKQVNTNPQHIEAAVRQMAPAAIESAINKVHTKQLRSQKRKAWKNRIVAQADVRPDTEGSVTTMQQTYAFKDEPISVHVDLGSNPSRAASTMAMPQSLGEYFSRPRLIDTFTWTEAMGTGIQRTIQPWSAYLADPSLKEKTGGFGLIRGNLHLKFTVNGSPFYYGGVIAAYTPLSGFRTDTVSASTNLMLVQQSQKPHVWLNPQNTSTATMVCPFLYPYPMMETTLANYQNMGKVDLTVYVGLKSANGVTGSSVDIQTFAWLENTELAGPTNQPVAQSSIEYSGNGQISGPASAVANAANSLAKVPIIGPYAKATAGVASTVGKVASLFGFTNVPNIKDIEPIRQLPFELASTEVSAPVSKLSLQPKQEIAVGSQQHGGDGHDDLVIKRFAGRSSFLVGSLWPTTSVPGDILFTSFVTPQLWQTNGSNEVVFPPAGYLTQLFQYWRGSMKFTFKMIRSKYHRGRIQISWDRSADNLNEGASLGNVNTFSTVMDLDETDEVTFTVPYVQNRQFLTTATRTYNSPLPWSAASAPPNMSNGISNGVINVRVLNRLTAPEAASDVTMLVFVSAGDDIEYAAPRNPGLLNINAMHTLSSLSSSIAQSNIVYDDATEETSHQVTKADPAVYLECFGEKVTSLRELLHRSSLSKSWVFSGASDGTQRVAIPLKHMPPSPGIWNNGSDLPLIAGVPQYGFICPQHPIPWIANCFIGSKGSVNVTGNVKTGAGSSNGGWVDVLSIDRIADGTSLSSADRRKRSDTVLTTDTLNTNTYFQNTIPAGVTGKALSNTRTNASVAANLPFYSNSAFHVVDLYTTYNNQDGFSGANNDWFSLIVQTPTETTNKTHQSSVDVYYGTGPDYDLIFFINTPVIYYRTYTL